MSRRMVLAGGTGIAAVAAIGAAVATDTLDDAIRAVGVKPLPEPDPGDRRLAARARADADALVEIATSSKAPTDVIAALRQQAAALPTGSTRTSTRPDDLVEACRGAAADRAADAGRAVSVDLAQVLASMAAGLDQCRRAVEAAR